MVAIMLAVGVMGSAESRALEHVYRVTTVSHQRAEIVLRGGAQTLLAPGARWRREDASVIVHLVDGPDPLTIWARPGLGILTVPGGVQYITMRAKYRGPGDTEDGDRSSPGSRLGPARNSAVRHVAYDLLIGGEKANQTCLPLDIGVHRDGTATVSLRNPMRPFARC